MDDPALIFFAALAAFLCYRLYTVLGTKGGHEPDNSDQVHPIRVPVEPTASEESVVVNLDERRQPDPTWVTTVKEHYPAFSAAPFVDGAKGAYEMIVGGFAAGDLSGIRAYIAPPVYSAFEAAVAARAATGQAMEVTFIGIEKAEITSSDVQDGQIRLVVAFQSDQIRVVRDADGEIIDGDPNRIDLVKDVWTFSRPVNSNDPNWILSATDGAAPTLG